LLFHSKNINFVVLEDGQAPESKKDQEEGEQSIDLLEFFEVSEGQGLLLPNKEEQVNHMETYAYQSPGSSLWKFEED
jgi:hypothetical protein